VFCGAVWIELGRLWLGDGVEGAGAGLIVTTGALAGSTVLGGGTFLRGGTAGATSTGSDGFRATGGGAGFDGTASTIFASTAGVLSSSSNGLYPCESLSISSSSI
jgi:hypothetical protein